MNKDTHLFPVQPPFGMHGAALGQVGPFQSPAHTIPALQGGKENEQFIETAVNLGSRNLLNTVDDRAGS